MAYNLLMVDAQGAHLAVELAPDRPHRFSDRRVVTNHQGTGGDWPAYEQVSRTHQRAAALDEWLEWLERAPSRPLTSIDEPLRSEPVFASDFERSFATLYTATWRPRQLCGEIAARGRGAIVVHC